MKRNRGKQQNEKDQRSLQENQRYQGNTSCKGGLDKGQKWYGLTVAEDIKRWQEYTEELYKKELHNQDNHGDGKSDNEYLKASDSCAKLA